MDNQKETKSYRFHHLLIAFAVGAVVASGVLLVPSYGAQGAIGGINLPAASFTTNDVYRLLKENTKILQGVEQELGVRFDRVTNLLHPYSGTLGARLTDIDSDLTTATVNQTEWIFNQMNTMLHPYSGQLGARLTTIENRLP